MSEQRPRGDRAIKGKIRRRLLVNALVDPDEAARHLPAGLRAHVIDGGTVVGCCLLDINSIRPESLPAAVGTRLRAAAHRVSVEWDDEMGATSVGVYVPIRHTDSRAARALGGRWFPGIHRRGGDRSRRRGSLPPLVGAARRSLHRVRRPRQHINCVELDVDAVRADRRNLRERLSRTLARPPRLARGSSDGA